MWRSALNWQWVRPSEHYDPLIRSHVTPKPTNCDHVRFYYRAMLCIARTMPSQDVCPSVRLSVTLLYSVKTVIYIIKLCSPSGSHTTLVFVCQTVWQYSYRNSPNGRQMQGVWKNRNFLYTIQDRAIVIYGRRIGNRSQAFESYQFQWSWVILNLDFKVNVLFNVRSLENDITVYRAVVTIADQ